MKINLNNKLIASAIGLTIASPSLSLAGTLLLLARGVGAVARSNQACGYFMK